MKLVLIGVLCCMFIILSSLWMIINSGDCKCDFTMETRMVCRNGECCDYFVVTAPINYTIPRGFDCIGTTEGG
jgi:hypothetical protein